MRESFRPDYDCVTSINLSLPAADVVAYVSAEGCRWKDFETIVCLTPVHISCNLFVCRVPYSICEIDNKLHFNTDSRRKRISRGWRVN